jgi:hypothetical protein
MSFRTFVIGVLIAGLIIVTYVLAASKKIPKPEYTQIKEIEMIKPQKPVNIKLRRNASGRYTWEIRGNDVEQIIKTDRKLRILIEEE